MSSSSDFSSLPKWITPTATASGVLTTARVFGKKDCLQRAAEFILHWLTVDEAATSDDLSQDPEKVRVHERERGELRFHCLCVLQRTIPEDLKAVAKAEKWRASRTDSNYALGVLTRSRRALDLIPEKFVAPPAGGDFWDWQAAAVAAGAAAESQVTAENRAGVKVPPTPGCQVFAPRKKPPADVAFAPATSGGGVAQAGNAGGPTGAEEAGVAATAGPVADKNGDMEPDVEVVEADTTTLPSLAGAKRDHAQAVGDVVGNYDADLGITDLELKGVLFLMRSSKIGFEEALAAFKESRLKRSPVGSSLASSEEGPAPLRRLRLRPEFRVRLVIRLPSPSGPFD